MQFGQLKRREFITLLGGATAWPLAARAQPERIRRIGVLMYLAADDAEGQARLAAFAQALEQLGWSDLLLCDFRVTGPARLVRQKRQM
jgi:hypothetical protein